MIYQDQRSLSRGTIGVIGIGVAAALVLASPWLANRLGRTSAMVGSSADALRKLHDSALETGWQAAVAVQSAQTRQEWESVVDQWDQAIELLQTVKQETGDTDGSLAQKQLEYENYRDYALLMSAQQPLDYTWEVVTELVGDKSYILVDPNTADAQLKGPPLQLGANHIPQNLDYINQVLVSVGLPRIASLDQIQVLSDHQYQVSGYPAGNLVLHRTLCSQSFAITDKYDCFWKMTLSQR